jgi:hypothetical protein
MAFRSSKLEKTSALLFPDYLKIWNIDFTPEHNRLTYSHLRNTDLEREIEEKMTDILRKNFTFRFIVVENETSRIGKEGLESRLIGTVAQCSLCKPSKDWLGASSSENKIRESGLWQVQHLNSHATNEQDKKIIVDVINRTLKTC